MIRYRWVASEYNCLTHLPKASFDYSTIMSLLLVIALTQVVLSSAQFLPEASCDFTKDYCKYHPRDGMYQWRLGKGEVADISKLGDGFKAPESSTDFLYVDTTSPGSTPTDTEMTSVPLKAGTVCITFDAYKWSPSGPGPIWATEVEVYARSLDWISVNKWNIWSKLNQWDNMNIKLTMKDDFTLTIQVLPRIDKAFLAFRNLNVTRC